MRRKKILVVGGGFGQIPAIEAVRALGWCSLVVDRNASAGGMQMADEPHLIDIIDVPAVVELAKRSGVDGALTLQSDIGVPTVGAVVDALGLAGVGVTVARQCSNKIETRRCFEKAGVPQPAFAIVRGIEQAKAAAARIGYPCVVKAPASSGSRGVVKISGEEAVAEACAEAWRYAPEGELLVEEFISGEELGAQSFSFAGECRLVLPHNDTVSKPPYMIPVGHSFPVRLEQRRAEAVRRAVSDCVLALGITHGPANIDLILDQEGRARIIEVGARIGATCLPELVRHHTGIDWVREAVRACAGLDPDLDPKCARPCAARILEAPDNGILQSWTPPPGLETHPDVIEFEVSATIGETVHRLRKGTDRIGKVLTWGSSAEEAEALAEGMASQTLFEIKPER